MLFVEFLKNLIVLVGSKSKESIAFPFKRIHIFEFLFGEE